MAAKFLTISTLILLALAGCGSDSSSTSTSSSTTQEAEKPLTEVAHRRTEKPTIEVPPGPPPRDLQIRNLIEGEGVVARRGDEATVQYVAVNYQTKKEFDNSWEQGWDPFIFKIGEPRLIAGWSKGVEGMKVGGRREIIIPPQLGYGDRGEGQFIPPGATLILMVDLLGVKKANADSAG